MQPSIAASAAHDRLIAVLAQLHSLRYCPQVPALALILLSALSEPEAFGAMQALLRAQRDVSRPRDAVAAADLQHLPTLLLTRREEHAFIKTFRTLVKSYHPQLSAHLEALGAPVRAVYASWFRGFFTGWLPPEDVLKVVDAFLVEGSKVLLRVGIALLRLTKRKLKATTAGGDVDRAIRRWVARAVALRVAAGAAPAPSGLAPALAAALAAPAAADALLPDEYSWAALSAEAFDGVTGLARAAVRKLMDKYMAAGGERESLAPAAAAGAGAGAGGALAVHEQNTLLPARGDGGAAAATAPLAAAAAAARGAAAAAAAEPCATSTGVVYDALGVDADGASEGLAAWHNPKLVGIGSRLMTPEFAPVSARALEAGAVGAGRRLRAALYRPHGGGGGRPAWGLDADADDAAATGDSAQQTADEAQDAPLRAAAGWVAGATALLTGMRSPAAAAPAAPLPPPPLAAAAFSAASSPHLASLATLLPPSVAGHNWACAFSSDVHGWSLASLYAATSGLAPVLVFLQAQVRGGGGGAAPAATAAAADAPAASRLATAMSSRRPVFGFFASQGLRPAQPAGDALPAASAYGGRTDFIFQLFPELNILPVSNVEVETSAQTAAGAVAFYAPSSGTSDVFGAGNRTPLRRDVFLSCLPAHLCVGGGAAAGGGHPQPQKQPQAPAAQAARVGVHALRLGADLAAAVASTSLLADLSVPLDAPAAAAAAAAGGEVPLDVLAVEAFCFVDRGGAFLEHRDARGSRDLVRAKTMLLQTLEKYFAPSAEERTTSQLHTAGAGAVST